MSKKLLMHINSKQGQPILHVSEKESRDREKKVHTINHWDFKSNHWDFKSDSDTLALGGIACDNLLLLLIVNVLLKQQTDTNVKKISLVSRDAAWIFPLLIRIIPVFKKLVQYTNWNINKVSQIQVSTEKV